MTDKQQQVNAILKRRELFEKAQETQDAFWAALRELEQELGLDIDNVPDLSDFPDVDALIAFIQDND